jgi:hypothetical protein
MDRWIELSRLYREQLGTAPSLPAALAGLHAGASPGFRRLLDERADWEALATADWSTDARRLVGWFDDVRACDLGRGIDIIHVDLGVSPRGFEVSAWRWADRVMLVDEGLIEPNSVRTVSSPGIVHWADELADPWLSAQRGQDFGALAAWLFFCSFVPLQAFAGANLQSRWGLDREFAVLFATGDFVFHGGFATPAGWRRPLRRVEAPEHH